MKQSKGRTVLRTLLAAAVVGVGGVALAQAVEEVWVNRPALQIRETKGPVGVVATAKKGDKLTILGREDNWLRVRFGDKEGYVLANSTSVKQIRGGLGVGDALAGGSDASGLQTGAAARGCDRKPRSTQRRRTSIRKSSSR